MCWLTEALLLACLHHMCWLTEAFFASLHHMCWLTEAFFASLHHMCWLTEALPLVSACSWASMASTLEPWARSLQQTAQTLP